MKPQIPIVILITGFFCINQINAQTNTQLNTFDLSKYKTTDYSRKLLDFTGYLSQGYLKDQNDASPSHANNNGNNFSSQFNLNYAGIKNTRKQQQELDISMSLNPYGYNHSSWNNLNGIDTSKNNSTNNFSQVNISVNSTHRRYLNPKLFIETDIIGNLQLEYSKNTYDYKYPTTSASGSESDRFLNNLVKVPVKVGFGRIENIEDARLALYILDDMQKHQELSKQLTEEDILSFTEKITQLKNKRYFDSRKRRIYEIEAVDSFLREHNYTQAQDAVYFTSLLDNWEYANNPTRTAGNRFSFGIAPYYNYQITNYISNNRWFTFEKGLDISGDYISSKPINLNWQRNLEFQTGYTKLWRNYNYRDNTNNTNTYKTNAMADIVYLQGDWGWGLYPNTRSYHSLTIDSRIQKRWTTDISTSEKWNWDYSVGVVLQGYYYISERFSFNYNFNAGYNETKTEIDPMNSKYHKFTTNLNLSFKYSIF